MALFKNSENFYPDRIAIISDKYESIKYSELENISSSLQSKIPERSLVFSLNKNTSGSLCGYYSFLKNKIVPLMLDANMNLSLIKELIDNYRPEYLWLPNENVSEFSYNKEIHLVISGPHQKEYMAKIIKLIEILDLKNHVTFTGPLYNKIKWDAYYASEVFCLPTHQENFGLTLAESLSSRRPVITTNKTNIWKYIKNYKAGFVGGDNVASLQKKINEWLSLSKKEYNKMCINSLKCFNREFSREAVKKDFNEILKL